MRCDAIPSGLTVAACCVGQWTGDRGRTRPFRRHGRHHAGRAARGTRPADAQRRRDGRAPPGLLGLYEGIPLTSRTSQYAGVLPDRITIYRQAICGTCRTEQEAGDQAAPLSTRSPIISALTTTGSANSAGETWIRSARMRASAAMRYVRITISRVRHVADPVNRALVLLAGRFDAAHAFRADRCRVPGVRREDQLLPGRARCRRRRCGTRSGRARNTAPSRDRAHASRRCRRGRCPTRAGSGPGLASGLRSHLRLAACRHAARPRHQRPSQDLVPRVKLNRTTHLAIAIPLPGVPTCLIAACPAVSRHSLPAAILLTGHQAADSGSPAA